MALKKHGGTPKEFTPGQRALMKAYRRIRSKETWCSGHFALAKNGMPAEPKGQGAVQWCAVGALESCDVPAEIRDAVYREAQFKAPHYGSGRDQMMRINDRIGHSAVVEVFEAAIVKLKICTKSELKEIDNAAV